MIFTDKDIRGLIQSGHIKRANPDNVNPASLDLTLNPNIMVPQWWWYFPITRWIMWHRNPLQRDHKVNTDFYWKRHKILINYVLQPGQFILASTNEKTRIPDDASAIIMLKSSMGRRGLDHALSVWGDPGFNGTWTMELHNISPWPIVLTRNMRIAQLITMKNTGTVNKSYEHTGRYQNQDGVTASKEERI